MSEMTATGSEGRATQPERNPIRVRRRVYQPRVLIGIFCFIQYRSLPKLTRQVSHRTSTRPPHIDHTIETEKQYQQLRLLGCEYGQGYMFSHPVNSEAVLQLLAQDAHRDAGSEPPFGPSVVEEDVVVGYSM